MGRQWGLDDIGWENFDPTKIDPDMVMAVKAASLVEANSRDYVTYLLNVFKDDVDLHGLIRRWGDEEEMHGLALAAWAKHADPRFDFEDSLRRFRAGYRLPLDVTDSVRGSRAAELLARCVVECGTSSYYSAIRDAAEEPVLKQICHMIAGDEFRHFKLFYDNLKRYNPDQMSLFSKLRVALGRINEADDDELSYAFHCANFGADMPYDRVRSLNAYGRRAYRNYRYGHLARAISMMMKAIGLQPHGPVAAITQRGAWWLWARRTRKLERTAA
ncbi:ferritin-like domain-containing protein [Oleomonas cavernae]|uniref:Ferritin-like domain-containing protein n=1 Tax=Oleomonas cavernae TaxID=2320859 RepID=A0A418WF67_9PROT|nr:ferritin-like domain-containing protein [Oleomonas cavernae]RJF88657.1 ferritin-like domain-containing protein [Oleomonas cavernae]